LESIKNQTVSGVKWATISRFTNIGISFVVGIILARLLTPADYGILGVYGIFFAIATTFIDSGFASALIQRKNLTNTDCSTIFYFNIAIGVLFYLIFFFTSPLIADFFAMPILEDIIKVTALNLLIGSLCIVQRTLYRRQVDFKTIGIAEVISNFCSGIVGISFAYYGYGVWALVYQQLTNSILNSVLLWILSKWRPLFVFSWKSFKEMFAYSGNILATGLLWTIYSEGRSFAIGKFYSHVELGLYTHGTKLSSLLSSNITGILQSVTFPILAKIQDDDERLINVYRKYIKFTSMIIFFLMFLLATVAEPLIKFLYTDKWMGAVIYTQIIVFSLIFDHISQLNLNIYYVKGKTSIVLRLEIIKRIISFAILIASIPFGVIAICLSTVIYAQIALLLNTYYTGKLFNYGFIEQWKDFGSYFIVSAISMIPSYLLTFLNLPDIVLLIICSIVALIIYIGILRIRKDEIFEEYIVQEVQIRYNKLKHRR